MIPSRTRSCFGEYLVESLVALNVCVGWQWNLD